MPKTHHIKLNEKWRDSVLDGSKPFEIRLNDRNYQKGDFVIMEVCNERELHQSWDVVIEAEIGCVTAFGQKEGWVVFGLLNINEMEEKDA